MSTAQKLRERTELLQQLRDSGDPGALARAGTLQKTWHDEQMALLSKDTYLSAMHAGTPPPGWVRMSELLDGQHKELRDRLVPELSESSDKFLRGRLQPDESGFRTEIYVPDPSILGPGYQVTVVPKGSAGQVMTSYGLRDTTVEDFAGNNGPQGIGLKTDYYDRAMGLAVLLDQTGLRVEYAGHSLGGGLATAMSSVTGEPATTFNAANLHPDTPRRFAAEHAETRVHDLRGIVTTYHVKDELLNPELQDAARQMPARARTQAANIMTELANASQDPVLRQTINHALPEDKLPQASRQSFFAFLDELAKDGHARQALRDMPPPASPPIVLDEVKTHRNGLTGPLVDRNQPPELRDALAVAGPAVAALNHVATGARLGRETGEVVAASGRVASQALDTSGDVVRTGTHKAADFSNVVSGFTSDATQTAIRTGGEGLARTREAAGHVEAAVDHAQGAVQDHAARAGASVLDRVGNIDLLPDSWQRGLHQQADDLRHDGQAARTRNRAEAAEAEQHAHRDAQGYRAAADAGARSVDHAVSDAQHVQRTVLDGTGSRIDAGLEDAGRTVRDATRRAPLHGQEAGALAAASTMTNPFNPVNYPVLAGVGLSAYASSKTIPASANESFERHLMTETVVPSMEARANAQEQQARILLRSLQGPEHAPERQSAPATPSERIELESPTQHNAREQASREANREGLSHDEVQQAVTVPTHSMNGGRREDESRAHDPGRNAEQRRYAVNGQVDPGTATPAPAPPPTRPTDPRDPEHPDHRLHGQIEAGVARIDASAGRSFDATSERLTMSTLADAKAAGITSADHLALNTAGKPQQDGSRISGGTLLFVMQGQDPADPAARRSITDVAQAVERPLEQSQQKLDAVNQQLVQQQPRPTQDNPTSDGPFRGPRV